MMETLMTVALFAAVVVAAVVAYSATRPDTFSVQRSMRIAAPPSRIFPLINNLRAMNTWNPFADMGPGVKAEYLGPPSGPGAAHTWSGTGKSGSGRIEIIEALPPSQVIMRLQMIRPMPADNTVEFTLLPDGDATNVTWAMSGRQPLMAKIMTVVIDCDKMVGGQFEKGLSQLKALAEASPKA